MSRPEKQATKRDLLMHPLLLSRPGKGASTSSCCDTLERRHPSPWWQVTVMRNVVRPCCCVVGSERGQGGWELLLLCIQDCAGTVWHGRQAQQRHQQLVNPSLEPSRAKVAIHMTAAEPEGPIKVLTSFAETPVRKSSSDAGPAPAHELRELLLLLLPR